MIFEILLALQTASAKPIDPATWIAASDYPQEALESRAQGTVRVTLEVDADGRPTACAIAKSSEFPILDSTTCDLLMQRARFEPARDDEGNGVADSYSQNVRWQIPVLEFEPGMVITSMRLSPDTTVLDCETELRGTVPAMMLDLPCESMVGQRLGPRALGFETVRTVLSRSLAGGPFGIEPEMDWGTLTGRQTTKFEITGDGAVANCRVVASVGGLPSESPCEMLSREAYAPTPDGSTREALLDIAFFAVRATTARGTP